MMLARTVNHTPELSRPSGIAWHVVYTSPQGEGIANKSIRALGFDAYMPLERTVRIVRRRKVEVERPLFSRYLFVGVEMLDDWKAVLDLDGVEDVLRNNDIPSRVPVAWIEMLRKLEGLGSFDRRKNAPTPFQIGEMVRVSAGPFSGLNARIESFAARLKSASKEQRAKVLLDFLGQQTRMEMDVVSLERL